MAEERTLREKYKTNMSEWREKVAEEKKVEREEREEAAMQASEAGHAHEAMEHEGMASNPGTKDNKWMRSMPNRHKEDVQLQQQAQQIQLQQNHVQDAQHQQHQVNDMASSGVFANPYFQAAAFGGNASLGLNPAAASANAYRANAFANQSYMQGMQGTGNSGLSLFGKFIVLNMAPRCS
jgi:hypothetical protein